MLVKICGARTLTDMDLLARSGADLVGLWHGIPGGHADLRAEAVAALAASARLSGQVQPVLVTFLDDVARLADVLTRTGIGIVQLHGYQPPALVKALKAAVAPGLVVIKVLHVRQGPVPGHDPRGDPRVDHLRGSECVERPLVRSYERAGTDLFLFDTATADGRIGSTGQPLPVPAALDLADAVTRPFLLAGGLSADNLDRYGPVCTHPRFYGIDVDSGARDRRGRLRGARVTALTRHRPPVTPTLAEAESAPPVLAAEPPAGPAVGTVVRSTNERSTEPRTERPEVPA